MPKKRKVGDAEGTERTDQESIDGLAGIQGQSESGTGPAETLGGPASSGTGRESITIRLTSNGKIDLEGMREKTTVKLKAAIEATPEIAPGFGEIHLDGANVPDFMVNAVYQLIGGIEQWVFARKYGSDIAQIMAYRPQDIAMLSEPTKAVMAKYLPKLGKYQEETALVMALASIHIGKVQAMNAMLANQEALRPDVTTINKAPITEIPQ